MSGKAVDQSQGSLARPVRYQSYTWGIVLQWGIKGAIWLDGRPDNKDGGYGERVHWRICQAAPKSQHRFAGSTELAFVIILKLFSMYWLADQALICLIQKIWLREIIDETSGWCLGWVKREESRPRTFSHIKFLDKRQRETIRNYF